MRDAIPTRVHGELRSFGRRRGRALSPRQNALITSLLPKVRLDLSHPAPSSLEKMFCKPVSKVWLEIGFGAAEHLIFQARGNRDVGIIGCEPYVDGVVKALTAIDETKLENVLLHDDDVRDVLRWLPERSLERVFILFPDPWPKARQRKRRLINPGLFELLARSMRDNGQLIISTDIEDYVRTILVAAQSADVNFVWHAQNAASWRERPSYWPPTRYEQKAIREGRAPYFFVFERREHRP